MDTLLCLQRQRGVYTLRLDQFLTLQALLAAPADSWHGDCDNMALAFANRSVLCMRQGRLGECMRDNTIALLLLDSQ